jgi:hypothetical protein
MAEKKPDERRGAHEVQTGGIRIIILRVLFFLWVGSGLSRGDSQGEMVWPSLAPGAISSQASLCGGQAGR